MSTGSCVCGAVKFSCTGPPLKTCLCHCTTCQKLGGAPFSSNIVVQSDQFTLLSGTPKEYATIGGSGNPATLFFCGECSSTLWSEGKAFPGLKVIKVGLLDDAEVRDMLRPEMEQFTSRRVQWLSEVEGVEQRREAKKDEEKAEQ